MTFSVNRALNSDFVLSSNEGWTYKPTALADKGEFLKGHYVRAWKAQAPKLARRVPAYHRDPVAVTCVLDALLRAEHTHVILATNFAEFLNEAYPQFSWAPKAVGWIMADLAEAAKAPRVGPEDIPIAVAVSHGYTVYQINTSPRAWRWLTAMRFGIGELAEAALAAETTHGRTTTLWADFPYAIAERS